MSKGVRAKGSGLVFGAKGSERFLETWVEARERTGWLIHAYVQMSNHRHGFGGHLFQGRYKALPVAPEERGYFLQLSSYIHLKQVLAMG